MSAVDPAASRKLLLRLSPVDRRGKDGGNHQQMMLVAGDAYPSQMDPSEEE